MAMVDDTQSVTRRLAVLGGDHSGAALLFILPMRAMAGRSGSASSSFNAEE